MKKILLFVAVSGFAVSGFALSAAHRTGWKDGPHFAYPNGGDVRHEEAGYGWQVGYEWNRFLSTELSISRQTDRIDDLSIMPSPFDSTFDLELVSVSLSARLSHRWDRFGVYAGGGFGYYYMKAKAGKIRESINLHRNALPGDLVDYRVGLDLRNKVAFHALIGAEYVLSSSWEVFAEYRWVFLDSKLTVERIEYKSNPPSNPLALGATANDTRTDFDYNHGLLRVGVNYRF